MLILGYRFKFIYVLSSCLLWYKDIFEILGKKPQSHLYDAKFKFGGWIYVMKQTVELSVLSLIQRSLLSIRNLSLTTSLAWRLTVWWWLMIPFLQPKIELPVIQKSSPERQSACPRDGGIDSRKLINLSVLRFLLG